MPFYLSLFLRKYAVEKGILEYLAVYFRKIWFILKETFFANKEKVWKILWSLISHGLKKNLQCKCLILFILDEEAKI